MFCIKCGFKLIEKELEHEGIIPYCTNCQEYRFKMFNTAVSMIVVSKQQNQLLLIKQYQKDDYILCAGYVNHQETLEHALARELKEELGLNMKAYRFMKSLYFPKSNSLLVNFAVLVEDDDLSNISTWEVDEACWFSFDEAKRNVKANSYAQQFLNYFLETYKAESFFTH